MERLPLVFDVRGRTVLLAGGGEAALNKAETLVRAGARLRLCSPDADPRLRELVSGSGGSLHERLPEPADFADALLAIGASGDRARDEAFARLAAAARVPVNIVDVPELCSFTFPAIIDRSPLLVAVSSGGEAPLLARRVRERIEAMLPTTLGRLAQYLGARRNRIREHVGSQLARLRVWERLVDGPVAERVLAGDEAAADALLERELLAGAAPCTGEVFLVGAGPGDPELLSLRALRLMQDCDVVLHDRLVSPGVLERVRKDALRIYVGKRRDQHAVPQPDINELLVEHARAGRRVLRLKGGDPFIFGRGGEEIERLAEAGIPFQVVPGITAASGCAAYAGIPLTHRDHAHSVRFVAGHLRDGVPDLDWDGLVRPRETLVFYMGLVGLPQICRQLVLHGMDAHTPVALIQQGTLAEQRVLISTLERMPADLEGAGMRAPTLAIVGTVVSLQPRLRWFGAPAESR